MERIKILHTNDLHSHFENWPKIRRFLLAEQKDPNATVYTFDLGDFIDRFHPLTEATSGKANIELMNEVHYDAVTIGNNEGIGSAKKDLNQLYDAANFDVVLGNLKEPTTNQLPDWACPYKILETADGTRLAILGLTAYFPLTYAPNGWRIETVDTVLPDLLAEVKNEADVIILLSHLGISEDRRLAKIYPELDIIIGSHTHHLLPSGEIVNGTLLAAAGKWGRYIGTIELLLKGKQIIDFKISTVTTDSLAMYPDDEREILTLWNKGNQLLEAESVGFLPKTLSNDEKANFPLTFCSLKALQRFAGVDVAILNSGLFLGNLPKGMVNMGQLHQILPHPMHIIKVTLPGSEIKRLVLEMEKARGFLRHFPMVGMGFRGKVFGSIVYQGLSFDEKTQRVSWLGQVLDEQKNYTFATVDHFLFIPFFPTIEIKGEIEFIFPEFIRQVFADYLSELS
ncbi:MAG: metallophosphoesterase [Streptococcaceae bacterium]|jgi:2',3'-cyclic-nucleotide 2'-phosphodiesterase (5'-nucleotidase family)|nr:metallophosphoesterase [Streptococcaceae bacterium]